MTKTTNDAVIINGITLSPDFIQAVENRGTKDDGRAFNVPLPINREAGDTAREVAVERAADPIIEEADIDNVVTHLLNDGRYRDCMLFVIGINTGLRYSDLISLRFSDLIDEQGYFVEDVALVEIKTRNTRGKTSESGTAKPRNRHLYLNEAARAIIRIYLQHNNVSRGDLLFRSERNGKYSDKGLSHTAVDNIFKSLTKQLGIEGRYSTHFMRKTFSYHLLCKSQGDTSFNNRSVEWLQMTLGHSSLMTTLRYAGYLGREIKKFYSSLNLGLPAIERFIHSKEG